MKWQKRSISLVTVLASWSYSLPWNETLVAEALATGTAKEGSFHLYTRRKIQTRKKHGDNRKPKFYWKDPSNLKKEIRSFWISLGLDLPLEDYDVLVPNNRILMICGRHDLQWAISSNGGRSNMDSWLGGARILPGPWHQVVASGEPEIERLVQLNRLPLSTPPSMPEQNLNRKRWSHRTSRKPIGYWTKQLVVKELFEYVEQYQIRHDRPSVWMPRLGELSANGRDDLRQAIVRFGGSKKICKVCGMVSHQEWFYFEGQLELLVRLKEYLDEHHDGDYSCFPVVSNIQRNGHSELYRLIQYYGGRKFVAARYGFDLSSSHRRRPPSDLCWGPFDLVFAIDLLTFVKEEHVLRQPPLKPPALAMPSESRLRSLGGAHGDLLVSSIVKFGGFENVARRLGLAFFC